MLRTAVIHHFVVTLPFGTPKSSCLQALMSPGGGRQMHGQNSLVWWALHQSRTTFLERSFFVATYYLPLIGIWILSSPHFSPARSKNISRKSINTEISPLRFASVEMTKGRGALPGRVVAVEDGRNALLL